MGAALALGALSSESRAGTQSYLVTDADAEAWALAGSKGERVEIPKVLPFALEVQEYVKVLMKEWGASFPPPSAEQLAGTAPYIFFMRPDQPVEIPLGITQVQILKKSEEHTVDVIISSSGLRAFRLHSSYSALDQGARIHRAPASQQNDERLSEQRYVHPDESWIEIPNLSFPVKMQKGVKKLIAGWGGSFPDGTQTKLEGDALYRFFTNPEQPVLIPKGTKEVMLQTNSETGILEVLIMKEGGETFEVHSRYNPLPKDDYQGFRID